MTYFSWSLCRLPGSTDMSCVVTTCRSLLQKTLWHMCEQWHAVKTAVSSLTCHAGRRSWGAQWSTVTLSKAKEGKKRMIGNVRCLSSLSWTLLKDWWCLLFSYTSSLGSFHHVNSHAKRKEEKLIATRTWTNTRVPFYLKTTALTSQSHWHRCVKIKA